MGKSKDISAEVIAQITILIDEKTFTLRQIAQRCKVSKSTVQRIQKNLNEGKNIHHRTGRCGRKSATSAHYDRAILRLARNNPAHSLSQLNQEWRIAGVDSKIKSAGFKARTSRKVPTLTKAMKNMRLKFANMHQHVMTTN